MYNGGSGVVVGWIVALVVVLIILRIFGLI